MTADQPPDAAVQIAIDVWEANTHDPDLPRDVVAALARAGWLTPPERVAALEAAGRALLAQIERNGPHWQYVDEFRAVLDAAPAETTSGEAGCECDHVGPGLCFVHGPASQSTDDPPAAGAPPVFCP